MGAREFGEADDDDFDVLLPIGCRARLAIGESSVILMAPLCLYPC